MLQFRIEFLVSSSPVPLCDTPSHHRAIGTSHSSPPWSELFAPTFSSPPRPNSNNSISRFDKSIEPAAKEIQRRVTLIKLKKYNEYYLFNFSHLHVYVCIALCVYLPPPNLPPNFLRQEVSIRRTRRHWWKNLIKLFCSSSWTSSSDLVPIQPTTEEVPLQDTSTQELKQFSRAFNKHLPPKLVPFSRIKSPSRSSAVLCILYLILASR